MGKAKACSKPESGDSVVTLVNKGNSLTVAPGSAVLVLGPLSALVVESKG